MNTDSSGKVIFMSGSPDKCQSVENIMLDAIWQSRMVIACDMRLCCFVFFSLSSPCKKNASIFTKTQTWTSFFFLLHQRKVKNFNLHWNTLADWYFLFIFQGFLKIPIWWFKPSSHMKHGENGLDQVNGLACRMDDLQVSPAGGELYQFSKGVVLLVITMRAFGQKSKF